MGGFAAQEAIISLTGKFSPLRQWVRKARERVGREGGRGGRERGREGEREGQWYILFVAIVNVISLSVCVCDCFFVLFTALSGCSRAVGWSGEDGPSVLPTQVWVRVRVCVVNKSDVH